jgi:uncharacterized protein YegL
MPATTQIPSCIAGYRSSYESLTQTVSLTKEESLGAIGSRYRKTKHLLFLITVLATVLLLPASAHAGTGTFRDGKFNFCVSVRFNATDAQLQRIREVFGVASQILGDVTDGQHQFGTISIVNNSGASDQADFWIFPPPGLRATGTIGGYGLRGWHISLYYGTEFAQPDTIRDGLVVVHEFAHHAYGVEDEYYSRMIRNPDGTTTEIDAHCPGADRESPTLSYCIMDDITKGTRKTSFNYSVNEFCVASNHDKPNADGTGAYDTAQSLQYHNDSCWETMSKIERKWRLNLPNGLPQDAPPSTQPLVFNTSCAGQTQRVVLLIDRSGSMTSQSRLAFAKTGAFHFVSLFGAGDSLGIVSFSTTASVDFPLTAIDDAARNNAKTALNAITAGGSTNMGDGLLAALSLLNSGNCTDCQKTIILLSDGDSNVGVPPESLIQTLQATDVKVIAATVGADISVGGERSLKTIANQTGGGYVRAKAARELLDFLVQLAFGTSGYRGVANAPNNIGSGQVMEIPVLVETGAASSYFGISLADQTDSITLALRKPSGVMLTETNASAGQFTSNLGMKLFKVSATEAGTWTMVLTTGIVRSGDVQVFSYAQHDGTDFWPSIDNDNILSTEALRVHATPTHDGRNVVGGSVTGQVVRPDGSQVLITLFDDGSDVHGDASANDGIYSVLFDSYSGFGTYTFNLKYQSTTGQTYTGEQLPNADGVIESFSPIAVPPSVRITSATAIVSNTTVGDTVWFDDALPEGATPHADDEGWYWVDANPGPFSGKLSHQSRDFAQLDLPNNSLHQHYFEGATALSVNAGDRLFTYLFLDVNRMPREIMLQWKDANGWEHRAYWGANRIDWGIDGTNSRRFMGPLPKAGQWVRLEVPASLVGLEGSAVNGMAFTLDAGRATFDLAGKTPENAAPLPVTPPGEVVWIEDSLPAGAVTAAVNDQWNLVTNPVYSGQAAHQSQVNVNHNTLIYRSHSFTGAQTPMQVNPGDVLFTYVYVDPSAPAQQIMLQWYDGTSWEHRAFWSNIFVGSKMPNSGVWGTESQRYMGGLPPSGSWYRLEVPASYVGLEGKAVSGMAFSLYGLEPTATWDRSGKAAQITSAPRPLSATAGVFRLFNSTYGYAFETTDLAALDHTVQTANVFFAHTSQAAATVPMYRFRRPGNYEYFYSQSLSYDGNGWVKDGVAFYVFPDGSTPGTVPLYLYHDSQFHYFLTVNQSEAAGMTFDAIWAYTYAINPVAPVNAAPVIGLASPTNGTLFTAPATVSINASASDSDGSISKVEFFQGSIKLGEVDAAPYTFNWNNVAFGSYVLTAVATDNLGSGAVSNPVNITVNAPPNVNLTSPGAGTNFPANTPITINASASDSDGTIAKVEFFANGNKLGEVTNGPYVFTWNNASTGTYSVTATATDNLGATSTSGAVSITVRKSDQTITFDPIPDKTYGDAPFSINASSSSGLPVSFTVISGAATLSANTVTITGAGSVSIRAGQGGNDSFNPAPAVTRSFNVAKAAATITLGNLSQTYDGTPKTATVNTNPAGLSGVAVTYNGSTTAPTNAGNYSVVASLTNNNYTASDAPGTLAIAKASQTITFNALAGKTYGDVPFALSGSSSSGLTVSFSIVSGPATISGSTVTITGVGTVTVRASQAGNTNYNLAADVDRSFIVAKCAATITLSNLSQTYNGTPKPATATTNPAGLSGVAITYNGSSTTPTNAGSYSVIASLTNDNYTASHATETLLIGKAAPTISWSDPSGITYGTALSSAQLNATASFGGSNLPGSFAYTPAAGTVLNPGNGQLISTIFTPTDSANFITATGSVHINVNGRTNVALTSNGGTATASSYLSSPSLGAFLPIYVIDGSRWARFGNDAWIDNTNGSFPDWIEVNFNGSKTINEIDVFTTQADAQNPVEPTPTQTFAPNGGITDFEVEYWSGSAWIAVPGGSITGNDKVWRQISFSNITTSKIRVIVNDCLNHSLSRVAEVEAWTPPGSAPPATNYALTSNGGTATASSYLSSPSLGAFLPVYVIDGSRWARFSNDAWIDNTSGSFPDWVEVDFNGSKIINEIDVFTTQADAQNPVEPTPTQTFAPNGGITDFEVQYWSGSAWIAVPGGSITGNDKVWRQISFSNITTSKIRVMVNDCLNHSLSRVAEVEAWGP